MRIFALISSIVAVAFASVVLVLGAVQRPAQPPMPKGADMTTALTVPPVPGYARGEEILFIHTEASDDKIAAMLTTMMGSPVLVVPQLGNVPEIALADVFVFTNGVPGVGPMGFQADVFDEVPGDEGYSPLRAINLVTWNGRTAPRALTSAEDVKAAAAAGEVSITRPSVVVNMPLLTWPGGHR